VKKSLLLKCNGEKSLESFYNDKSSITGKHSVCIECHKEYKKLLSKDKIKEHNHNSYIKNADKRKESVKLYQEENKDMVNEKKRIYINNRRKTDPLFRLNDNIKTSIYNSFKNKFEGTYKKRDKTYNILGCTKQ